MKLRVGVDIDDTICEFMLKLCTYVNVRLNMNLNIDDYTHTRYHDLWNMSELEAQSLIADFIFIGDNPTFDLNPISNAYKVLSSLTNHIDFYAISARDTRLKDVTRLWLNLHFPSIFKDTYLCNYYGDNNNSGNKIEKTEVCKQLGVKIFIDDNPSNITCNSIDTIIFDQPWNRHITDKKRICKWEDVYNYLSLESLIKNVDDKISDKSVLIGFSGKLGSGRQHTRVKLFTRNFLHLLIERSRTD